MRSHSCRAKVRKCRFIASTDSNLGPELLDKLIRRPGIFNVMGELSDHQAHLMLCTVFQCTFQKNVMA